METFDFPLRDSSGHALGKTTGFGGSLVRRVEECMTGATSIKLQLYQVEIVLDGFFEQAEALDQAEEIIRDLCNDAWLEPTITAELRPRMRISKKDKEDVHPFGKLPLRLHEARQRGLKKLIRNKS